MHVTKRDRRANFKNNQVGLCNVQGKGTLAYSAFNWGGEDWWHREDSHDTLKCSSPSSTDTDEKIDSGRKGLRMVPETPVSISSTPANTHDCIKERTEIAN